MGWRGTSERALPGFGRRKARKKIFRAIHTRTHTHIHGQIERRIRRRAKRKEEEENDGERGKKKKGPAAIFVVPIFFFVDSFPPGAILIRSVSPGVHGTSGRSPARNYRRRLAKLDVHGADTAGQTVCIKW